MGGDEDHHDDSTSTTVDATVVGEEDKKSTSIITSDEDRLSSSTLSLSSKIQEESGIENTTKEHRNDVEDVAPEPTTLRRTSGVALPGAYSIQGFNSDQREDDETTASQEESPSSGHDDSSSSFEAAFVTTAIKVEDEPYSDLDFKQMEEQVRDQIIREAVEANVVVEVEKVTSSSSSSNNNNSTRIKSSRFGLAVFFCVFFLILVIISILLVASTTTVFGNPSTLPTIIPMEDVHPRPTLDIIRERGFLRCGMLLETGFTSKNFETGEFVGTNIDQCRALSIAIFGIPNKVEYVFFYFGMRYQSLVNGTVDVLTAPASFTLERATFESTSKSSLTYSTVYHYSGMTFNGIPEYVDCAEHLDKVDYDDSATCRDLKICVTKDSRSDGALDTFLPQGLNLVRATSDESIIANMNNGTCNVYAGHSALLTSNVQRINFEYKVGTRFFSKELLGLVTRNDDAEFSNLVNLVVNVFILADSENITKSNAHEIGKFFVSSSPNDDTVQDLALKMIDIISEVGNHGDIYSKAFGQLPLQNGSPVNTVYKPLQDDSGLLYTIPFGDVQVEGPSPTPSMTLDTIMNRGYLRCGVIPYRKRPGVYVEEDNVIWSEFNVEFCLAVAGAIFSGSVRDSLEIIDLWNSKEAYISLTNGSVDVVAGARVTLEADYRMPITGEGYSFSTPYFFDKHDNSIQSSNTSSKMDAYAMMTRETDKQWSDFVYWVIMSLIYAEEKNIDQSVYSQMPAVNLFGKNLQEMFRFAVRAVGSYGQVYSRTLESIIPRSGANTLNCDNSGPQLFAIPYS